MGRLVLIARLAVRDLRHRPVETVLVLLAITAAAATLSLGLVLHGVSVGPSYQQTRAATRGPDVVATDISASQLPAVRKQAAAAGAGAIGGPYPVAVAVLRAGGYTAQVTAQGRDQAGAAIDQPLVWQGTWVRPGGVVIERSFADALGVHVGDQVQLNGRRFLVTGIAITAASPPYPETGFLATPPAAGDSPGLVWLTRADTRALATAATPLTYTVSVRTPGPAQTRKLAGPSGFQGNWTSARAIAAQDAKEVQNEQLVLEVGSWLLGLLALATLAVLVGGRMADQTRRVGLLKAVGGTPGLVATVLLAEYLVLAVVAAAAGLTAGRLIAPSLTSLSFFAGLTVAPAEPALTTGTIALVVGVALAVVTVATLVPAARAARTSTVSALADSARPPRRHGWLIAFSSRLPVPLLLGLRLAARRPRRSLLSGVSIAITVATIVAVLVYRVSSGQQPSGGTGAAAGPPGDPVGQVMLVVTVVPVVLVVLAAVNAIFVTWATTLDARYPSALAAALGATPGQLAAGFSAAQLLPALPGVIIGIPAGVGLYAAVSRGGAATIPPGSWLLAVGIGTLLALAVLTAIPVGIGVRRPVSPVLQAE